MLRLSDLVRGLEFEAGLDSPIAEGCTEKETYMRVLAVDPRTTRALVVEVTDLESPGRLWLVAPLWERVVAPRRDGELVVLRRGWICDLYTPVASFAAARNFAREAVEAYKNLPPLAYRNRDDVGPFRPGISMHRSVQSFLTRRAKHLQIGRWDARIAAANRQLWRRNKAVESESVRDALSAAHYRIRGERPPPKVVLSEEDMARVRARVLRVAGCGHDVNPPGRT